RSDEDVVEVHAALLACSHMTTPADDSHRRIAPVSGGARMTPMLRVSWRQALAWRMRRQLLDPVGTLPVEDVVRRLCGIQAQVASSAELAVRVRQAPSRPGEVAAGLAEGRLIKTW